MEVSGGIVLELECHVYGLKCPWTMDGVIDEVQCKKVEEDPESTSSSKAP